MALKFIFFHFITAMVAVNLIFADEEAERLFGLPFFGGGGNGSNLPFAFPPFLGGNGSNGLPSLPFFDQLPSFFGGSRPERSVESQEDDSEENDVHERFFFGSIVSCNYTSQGGTNCLGCRQSLACYPNNVGRVRTCRGFLRYCNEGRCSLTPATNCTGSS